MEARGEDAETCGWPAYHGWFLRHGGDGRYGSKVRDCSIALYSHKIAFNHPRTKEMVEFISNPDFSVYPWNSGSVDNA